MIEQLEQETPALVRWYDQNKKDDNDHPLHYESPDKIPSDSKTLLAAYCTAVWVSPDTMLTAAHCVDDAGKPADDDVVNSEDPSVVLQHLLQMLQHGQNPLTDATRWNPTGQSVYYSVHGDITPARKSFHSAKVSAFFWDRDMALLKADTPGEHPYARLRQGAIHDGEECHIVGHPAGNWWTYVHGYVAAHRPDYHDNSQVPERIYPVLQLSAPVFFGNSGGPAFDADGNLIGMADSISRVPETAYFLDRDAIQAFLEHERVLQPQR